MLALALVLVPAMEPAQALVLVPALAVVPDPARNNSEMKSMYMFEHWVCKKCQKQVLYDRKRCTKCDMLRKFMQSEYDPD